MLLLSLNCSSFSLFLRFAECEITAQRTQVDASFPTHTAVYTFFFFSFRFGVCERDAALLRLR